MKYKIGIIGHGFVGLAVDSGFSFMMGEKVDIRFHDKYKDSESLDDVVNKSEILFICLPTPMDADTGACNTSIIEKEIRNIDSVARKSKIIVIKSTVPPGTTDTIQLRHPKHTFLFNPEFLTEKNFINDFMEQDRIVLGTPEHQTMQRANGVMRVIELYEDFMKHQKVPGKIYQASCKEAEMTKYMANCFLATKVTFFNEMYQICQAANIDFTKAAALACTDKRIGSSHSVVPGPDGQFGFGGSCFTKDINALMAHARLLGVDPLLLESVWTKNLVVREVHEWEDLAQVNGNYKKEE